MLTYEQKHATCRNYEHVKKSNMHVVKNMHVVVYYCRTYYTSVRWEEGRVVEDMWYWMRRTSACVDRD
jgi:hypothetical protein